MSLEEESQDISVLEKYVVAPRMFKYVTSKGNETSARVTVYDVSGHILL